MDPSPVLHTPEFRLLAKKPSYEWLYDSASEEEAAPATAAASRGPRSRAPVRVERARSGVGGGAPLMVGDSPERGGDNGMRTVRQRLGLVAPCEVSTSRPWGPGSGDGHCDQKAEGSDLQAEALSQKSRRAC